ncbi:MAG: hypothetical protein AB7U82_01065 [Blastocatellales bacterium]
MQINDYVLKFTGKVSLPEGLEHGKTYAAGVEFEAKDDGLDNNGDGTQDKLYKAKMIKAIIKGPTGSIPSKDKSSQSYKLRKEILFGLKPAVSPESDDEMFYQQVMGGIRHYLPEIYAYIKKLDNH